MSARGLFFASVAVIALHTATDAFVAPEPGTTWRDHLSPGFGALAVLVAATMLYGRSRDGVRAAIALTLGALALVGAALAVADARIDGPRGEDWTGFLLGPAGVALLGLGAALLWRSRKPRGRRYLRRALLALAAALAAFWVIVPVAVAIVVTHRPRESAEALELGSPYERVVIRTSDGLDLHGSYVPSRNGAAVIVFPGGTSRAPHARFLARSGFGVLMLEMRGYARSDGAPNAYGWGATKDIDAGVRFLQARADVRGGRIGGLGFSVGGELMLEAAAANDDLRAVASEGAGVRSVRESRLRGPRGWFALPLEAVQTAAVAVISGELPPPALVDVMPRISPRPLFLIYAGHGGGGEDLQPEYFEAAREPKTIWRIQEATHTGGFEARPAEYRRRLVSFFEQNVRPR